MTEILFRMMNCNQFSQKSKKFDKFRNDFCKNFDKFFDKFF